MKPLVRSLFLSLLASLLLLGCGGGGGGGGSTAGDLVAEPLAVAGQDIVCNVGTRVALDARGSSDPQGQPMAYSWSLSLLEKPAGSAAALESPQSSVAAITPDLPGQYSVRLTVTNASGLTATDELIITARSGFEIIGGNLPGNPAGSPGAEPSAHYLASILNTSINGVIRALVSTSDGGLAAVAEVPVPGKTSEYTDARLVKIAPDGNLAWERTLSSTTDKDTPLVILERSASEFVVFGVGISPSNGRQAIFMARVLEGEATTVPSYFDFPDHAYLYAARPTGDGGFLLAGSTQKAGQQTNMLFAKVNAEGATGQPWIFGAATHSDRGMDALEAGNGDYLLLGQAASLATQGGTDIFLARMTPGASAPQWTRILGGGGQDEARAVEEQPQGLVIVGSTTSPAVAVGGSDYDIFVLATDANGVPTGAGPGLPWTLLGERVSHEYLVSSTKLGPTALALIGAAQRTTPQQAGFNAYLAQVEVEVGASPVRQWERVYGGLRDDLGLFVAPATADGLRIGGMTAGSLTDFEGPNKFNYRGLVWLADTTATGNLAPSALTVPDLSFNAASPVELDLAGYFRDFGGDSLRYAVSGLPPGLVLSAEGTLTGTTQQVAQDIAYPLTLTASDPEGLSASASFTLNIRAALP